MSKTYIPISVYKTSRLGDCSNEGVTYTHENKLAVEVENGNWTKEELDDAGYLILKLVTRPTGIRPQFEPTDMDLDGRHLMFGGAYVASSDGRFGRKYGQHPIPVHDRVENY